MILQNAQARKIRPQKYQDNMWHRLTFVAKYLIKKLKNVSEQTLTAGHI